MCLVKCRKLPYYHIRLFVLSIQHFFSNLQKLPKVSETVVSFTCHQLFRNWYIRTWTYCTVCKASWERHLIPERHTISEILFQRLSQYQWTKNWVKANISPHPEYSSLILGKSSILRTVLLPPGKEFHTLYSLQSCAGGSCSSQKLKFSKCNQRLPSKMQHYQQESRCTMPNLYFAIKGGPKSPGL